MFQSSAIKREKATRALIDYDGVAGDILANWKLTRSEWVPVVCPVPLTVRGTVNGTGHVPFVMRIASDLYHDAGETSTNGNKEE